MIMRYFLLSVIVFASLGISPAKAADDTFASSVNKTWQLYSKDQKAACKEAHTLLKQNNLKHVKDKTLSQAYYLAATCYYTANKPDKAEAAYKEVIRLDPKATQPRLDLATLQMQKGDFWIAEQQFHQVMGGIKQSSDDYKRIQLMLDNSPGKLQSNFQATFGVGYDSNVNSGPADTNHLLYNVFLFTLDPSAEPHGSPDIQTSLSANFGKIITSTSRVFLNLTTQRTDYTQTQEHNFNSQAYTIAPGLQKKFGKNTLIVNPYYTYQTLNRAGYQTNIGLNVSGQVPVQKDVVLTPYVRAYHQNYLHSNSRDGNTLGGGASLTYKASDKASIFVSGNYMATHATIRQYSYDNTIIGGGINYRVTDTLSGGLSYNFQRARYRDNDSAYGTQRKDNQNQYGLNLSYDLGKLTKVTGLSFNASTSYTDKKSNHSLQTSTRAQYLGQIVYNF